MTIAGRDHEADVVVVGAGGAGLPAALAARCEGAEVECIDENVDVGGHAILSGGRIQLGGGTSRQRQFGIDMPVKDGACEPFPRANVDAKP